MKNINWVKIISFIGVLIPLILINLGPIPAGADNGAFSSKVSSSLSLRVKMKTGYLFQADKTSADQSTQTEVDKWAGYNSIGPKLERVFIRFDQIPTTAQIDELNSLGMTAYPDSWIPPAGINKTGFILADMPVDKLDILAAKDYVVQLDTAEETLKLQNDTAEAAMNVGEVWNGGDTGAGITVAVLDSGLDTLNSDFPALVAAKDYSNYPTLDDTISNTVTGHGTHVTGSILGRGTNSNGKYKGVAPGASLVFLKVVKDITGEISSNAVTYAIRDAVDVYHAKILNLSLGGWTGYHDGSDAICQVVDYVTGKGATVFAAAGNEAPRAWHYSGYVNAGSTSDDIPIKVTSGSSYLSVNVVWYDGLGTHNGLKLQYYDSNHQLLSPWNSVESESPRGTESIIYEFNKPVGAGTYYLRVQNSSANQQFFHLYYMGQSPQIVFFNSDPNYTLLSPAEADSTIAVGSYVTRNTWTDYFNNSCSNGQTTGAMDVYSSHGPRVDSQASGKPNIVAPGSEIISLRDRQVYPWPNYNTEADIYPYARRIIDDDGQNLNGSGPADYLIMAGTSMACPMAVGVAALMLSKTSSLNPAQVRHSLELTAADKGDPGRDNIYGWGLINVNAAINTKTVLGSYSNAAYTTACDDFSDGSTQNTAYMYGSGFLKGHSYQVVYYDGTNKKVATDNVTSSSAGILSDQHRFIKVVDKPGTWHVLVCEPEFSPPVTYSASWAYPIVIDTFTVKDTAITGP